MEAARAAAAQAIEARLAAALDTLEPEPVTEAMGYALRGGKRLRGMLVIEGARLHGIAPEMSVHAAAAVEAIHAYSLVHDDLPAMDDDDLRRGQPTVHRRWDAATAILAGDGLHSLAFELVADARGGDAARRLELSQTLARAAGARGMVLGQARDIAAENAAQALTLAQVTRLQTGKTGALIRWSAEAGARLAAADARPLGRYAAALGLAFQITDDVLDVEGDATVMGKGVGKDAGAGKATFVSLMGLDAAKARARELADEAAGSLDVYGSPADTLRQVARFAISRDT